MPTAAREGNAMGYRTTISIAAAAFLAIASISTEALAYRGGYRGGGYHGGVHRGGAYRGGAYRGGVYRGGVYRGGVYRGGVYRGGVYRGGYARPLCGYPPYPACY